MDRAAARTRRRRRSCCCRAPPATKRPRTRRRRRGNAAPVGITIVRDPSIVARVLRKARNLGTTHAFILYSSTHLLTTLMTSVCARTSSVLGAARSSYILYTLHENDDTGVISSIHLHAASDVSHACLHECLSFVSNTNTTDINRCTKSSKQRGKNRVPASRRGDDARGETANERTRQCAQTTARRQLRGNPGQIQDQECDSNAKVPRAQKTGGAAREGRDGRCRFRFGCRGQDHLYHESCDGDNDADTADGENDADDDLHDADGKGDDAAGFRSTHRKHHTTIIISDAIISDANAHSPCGRTGKDISIVIDTPREGCFPSTDASCRFRLRCSRCAGPHVFHGHSDTVSILAVSRTLIPAGHAPKRITGHGNCGDSSSSTTAATSEFGGNDDDSHHGRGGSCSSPLSWWRAVPHHAIAAASLECTNAHCAEAAPYEHCISSSTPCPSTIVKPSSFFLSLMIQHAPLPPYHHHSPHHSFSASLPIQGRRTAIFFIVFPQQHPCPLPESPNRLHDTPQRRAVCGARA